MGFEITVDTPSMGLLEGSVEKVGLNPMTVVDEGIMFSRKYDLGQKFAQVLSRCSDLDKKKIKEVPFNDIMFIFIKLRNLSVGDTHYDFKVPCALCQTAIVQRVNLDSLDVKPLEDEVEPWEVTLPRNGSKIAMRHMRLGDQFQLDKYVKLARTKGRDLDPRFVAERLAATIVSVDGDSSASLASKIIFTQTLTAVDTAFINDESVKRDFGIDLRVTSECPQCFAEEDYVVRIDPSFFRPPSKVEDRGPA